MIQAITTKMLFTLQRYEFFSKSQHFSTSHSKAFGCCLPYKGTNFSANHNSVAFAISSSVDVVYPTKVRIFQQITTKQRHSSFSVSMLFTLQRYEFFSKSQPYDNAYLPHIRCCLPYKGTNFSANHNNDQPLADYDTDVVYPTKVRIFQQITT